MTSALLTVLCSLVGPLQRKPSYRAASWPRRGSRGQDLTEARGREWGTEGLSPMVQRRWILPTMPWGSGEVDLPSADPWDNCSLDWYLDYSLWKTLNQKRPAKLCPEPNRRNCEITNACRFKPFSFRLICFEAVQLWTGSISNSRLIIWGPKEKGKKKKSHDFLESWPWIIFHLNESSGSGTWLSVILWIYPQQRAASHSANLWMNECGQVLSNY